MNDIQTALRNASAISCVLFLSIQASSATIEVSSADLKSVIERNNSRVEAARFEVQAAKERQGSLRRSFMPSFEVYAAGETFTVGRSARKTQPTYGAEARLNLYNGGRDRIEDSARTLTAKTVGFQNQRVLSEELAKARITYWQVLYTQEQIELLKSAVSLNDENLRAAQRRIQSGVATESDRVEFEMNEVDLKRDLQLAQARKVVLHRELASLLNTAKGDVIKLKDQFTHEHEYESLLAHSETDHDFLFQENELKAEIKDLSIQKTRRHWLPRIDAYAAYNQFNEREEALADAGDRTEAVLGISFKLSLPEALETRNESIALAGEASALRALAQHERREIDDHLASEMEELRLLHDQVHDAEENIKRASRYYTLTKSEYVRGVKNSPDVLGASDKILSARLNLLEIIREFQISKSHLLSKMGK